MKYFSLEQTATLEDLSKVWCVSVATLKDCQHNLGISTKDYVSKTEYQKFRSFLADKRVRVPYDSDTIERKITLLAEKMGLPYVDVYELFKKNYITEEPFNIGYLLPFTFDEVERTFKEELETLKSLTLDNLSAKYGVSPRNLYVLIGDSGLDTYGALTNSFLQTNTVNSLDLFFEQYDLLEDEQLADRAKTLGLPLKTSKSSPPIVDKAIGAYLKEGSSLNISWLEVKEKYEKGVTDQSVVLSYGEIAVLFANLKVNLPKDFYQNLEKITRASEVPVVQLFDAINLYEANGLDILTALAISFGRLKFSDLRNLVDRRQLRSRLTTLTNLGIINARYVSTLWKHSVFTNVSKVDGLVLFEKSQAVSVVLNRIRGLSYNSDPTKSYSIVKMLEFLNSNRINYVGEPPKGISRTPKGQYVLSPVKDLGVSFLSHNVIIGERTKKHQSLLTAYDTWLLDDTGYYEEIVRKAIYD